MNHYSPTTLETNNVFETDEIKLELISNRDENTLKPIIERYFGYGNIICSDSCV